MRLGRMLANGTDAAFEHFEIVPSGYDDGEHIELGIFN
jgi:hypothetical protein